MNAADRRRLTPTLGSVAAVLLLVLIALWLGLGRGAHWRDDAAPPRLPPVGASTPPPVVQPLEHYAEVWQRPLFSPTRTPEPAAGDAGASSSDLELTGVILLPHLKLAILHDRNTNKDYRVTLGQPSHGGPALLELHPRSAVVEASGARVALQLIPGPSPDAGAQPSNEAAPESESVPQGTSAMVTRRGQDGSERPTANAATGATATARARALKARIRAQRQAAGGQGGDGG